MAEIVFERVSKSYGNAKVIEDLNLTIKDGAFTVLLGPSGCGKTTLLRMIAGIGPASDGVIYMDGEDISDIPPGKRNVAMVFQNYAIYPTMSVRENIEFCLKNNRVPKEERRRRVEKVAKTVGLEDYLNRKPSQLSGGQRQRIALARAMVKEPAVFLMDEPLSNLDAKLRAAMRSELIELHEQLKTTFVYVTHDQGESMAMADEIVLMDHGKIMQQGTPEEIYHDPDNVFTAQFIGTPPTNILKKGAGPECFGFRPEKACLARISGENPEVFSPKAEIFPEAGVFPKAGVSSEAGAAKKAEFAEEAGFTEDGSFRREGTILTREMLGSETIYKVRIPEGEIMVKSADFSMRSGEQVYVTVASQNLYCFDREGRRIRNAWARTGKEL